MKLGISCYSLRQAIMSGEMDILQVIQWIADQGGEHVEIVPRGFELANNPDIVNRIREKADEAGIEISNFADSANFIQPNEDAYCREIERVMKLVDITHRLGAKHMRHDVARRPVEEATISQFERDLERLVDACRQIADYAAQFGITTSVENHGRYVQKSDRVQRLVVAVDRPNFKTLLDVGNFLNTDEDPISALKNNIPYASMIHLKDFYVRPSYRNPGDLWSQTIGGNYIRGAIVGHGDIDMYEVIRIIKHSGFDGNISIEFEGKEECKLGSKTGLDNARKIWNLV
jgi:sugar phosphate isomerase/epimerase